MHQIKVDLIESFDDDAGKITLLEHIGTSGSLSQAARDMGMSYRRAWLLLSSLNDSFDEPVVKLRQGGTGGGGASLTALGRQLIDRYRSFEAEMQGRAAQAFRPLAARVRPLPQHRRP